MTVPATRLDGTGHAAAAPLTKGSAARLVGAGILLWLGLSAVGIGLWRGLGNSWIVDDDKAVSRWFVGRRTPTLEPPR